MDFSNAEKQLFDLIPAGTMCKLGMTIEAGAAGGPEDQGYLTQSRTSDALYLKAEFVVLEGQYAKRKLWKNFVLSGGKLNDNGEFLPVPSRAVLPGAVE